MALKRVIDIGEAFPTPKRHRLPVAPPADDVLDNVGTPGAMSPTPAPDEGGEGAEKAKPRKAASKEGASKKAGHGVHRGEGTDARRYRRTGRTYQFGARVRLEFAERVKALATEKNVTIGELLDAMLAAYDHA